ncbi:hypothetical protein [Chachezhania sediminis]|uniref:hypothetical protein n=1 Tax=Chachezhania sediminis TaxID=2599291 RepID=UPI001E2FD668|nr:hypothetical protein [Chachezhania sediminis]
MAADRCLAAIESGGKLETAGFDLARGDAGADWPTATWTQGIVLMRQFDRQAGGNVDPRVCEVQNTEYLTLGQIADATGAYADMMTRLVEGGAYYPRQLPPGWPKLPAMASELRSATAGPRGCRMAVSFVTEPVAGMAIFSVSEIGRAPCGTLPAEEKAG